MSSLFYLLVTSAIVLAVSLLALRHGARRRFNGSTGTKLAERTLSSGWDRLTSQLIARIFHSEDSDFVGQETSHQFARMFRKERTALSLEWLRGLRGQVNLSMRAHRMSARGKSDVKPAGEVALVVEFLLFQVTSGTLYLFTWIFGPLHAATLARYSLELTRRFREMTEDILPASTPVTVELMDMEPSGKNQTLSL